MVLIVKIIMKKHLLVTLVILFSPLFSFALTPTLASPPITDSILSATVTHITNLNTQTKTLTTKFKVANTKTLSTILEDRKREWLKLAADKPNLALTLSLSTETKNKLPPELQAKVEQQTKISGKIEVWHIDDFEHPENSRYNYFIQQNNKRINFYPTEPIYLRSGAEITTTAYLLADTAVADTAQSNNFNVTADAPPIEATGDQKTLILLINFLDSSPPPKTPAEIYDLTFNGQFQRFYQEQSYNKISFSGDVMGWYTLPRNQSINDPCGGPSNNEINQLVLNNNIDLSQYGRLVIAINTPCAGGYGTIGKNPFQVGDENFNLSVAWVMADSSIFSTPWAPGYPFPLTYWDFTLVHEMGHNLGVLHANGWNCGENVLRGDCRHEEYGNYFDAMGFGFYSLQFNSFYKELLGWIQPGETIQISSSGQYTLNPVELSSTAGNLSKKLAKIQSPYSTSTTLYLEYRRGIGFDGKLNDPTLSSNQQGLFVNNIIDYTFSRLLDMRPTTLWWGDDIFMVTYNSIASAFSDIGTGISIGPILSAGTSSITFNVGITEPQCVRSNPTIEYFDDRSVQAIVPGGRTSASGGVSFGYRNRDSSGCGGSNFKVVTNIPTTWLPTIWPEDDIFISPDDTSYQNVLINFIVPVNTPLDNYSFTVDVINLNTNYKTSKTFQVKIVNPPIISSITPPSGPIGTVAVISTSNLYVFNSVIFIDPTTENYFYGGIVTGDRTINLTIPEYINFKGSPCDYGCSLLLTPPGIYKISVFANGAQSEPIDFEVTSTTTPSFAILTPNGGETLRISESFNISWSSNNIPINNPVQLSFRPVGGIGSVAIMSYNSGNYSYTFSPTTFQGLGALNTGLYHLTINATVNGQTFSDTSDNPFTITLSVDQCLNISGIQTTIPAGYIRGGTVNCVISTDSGGTTPGGSTPLPPKMFKDNIVPNQIDIFDNPPSANIFRGLQKLFRLVF